MQCLTFSCAKILNNNHFEYINKLNSVHYFQHINKLNSVKEQCHISPNTKILNLKRKEYIYSIISH